MGRCAVAKEVLRALLLRIVIKSRKIWIEHRDRSGGGAVTVPHPKPRSATRKIVEQFPFVYLPADLDGALAAAIASRPWRVEAAAGPVPLAVFVEFSATSSELMWDVWLRDLLVARSARKDAADLIQVIRLNPVRGRPRPALSLPLTILTVDAAGEQAIGGLVKKHWYARDDVMKEHGLRIRRATPESLRTVLQEEEVDIALSDAGNVGSLLDTVRQVAPTRRPRLLVELGQRSGQVGTPLASTGEAQLLLPPMPPQRVRDLVTDFIYAIIHDQPLHDAVKETERRHAPLPTPLRLIANPSSDQALRLSDALGPLYDSIANLAMPQLTGLSSRLRKSGVKLSVANRLTARLRRAVTPHSTSIRRAVDLGRDIAFDFGRETTGLKPLAELRQQLQAADADTSRMAEMMARVVTSPDEREQLRQAQGRRVDVTMQQLAPERPDQFGPVKPDERLLPTTRYRIRVNIGARSPSSLMITRVPSIDPLLPKSDHDAGYEFEVVVYGKDFRIVGANSKPLLLPTFGGSDAASFEVVTPARTGAARLRLAIYYRNHLVQSFRLNAWIGDGNVPKRRKLGFALEYSRTARFANIAALGERAISIGVNANGANTHSLDIKSDKAAVGFSVAQQLLDQQIGHYRKLLLDATFKKPEPGKEAEPRFSTFPEPGAPISADFHEFTRKFADLGRDLYRALLQRRRLQPRLRALAQSAGETIQIVRFDPNFVFPWPAIYDFELPAPVVGATPPEVCRGVKVDQNGVSAPCGHGPTDGVYCITGFWGARHVIEELIGESDDSNDAINAIVRTNKERSIRLAIDEIEPHTEKMHETFAREMSSAYAEVGPSEKILDLLWNDAERPAVLAIVGHLETKDIDGQEKGPRIMLPGKQEWLRAEDIVDRIGRKGWERQPHSLILLMGCRTGATELGTLTGFVTALSSAPAAAVVGTECVAFTRLLTRFANDVTLALWGDGRLGASITEFRRKLLAAGNPLAFAFQAIGGADVHLVLGANS